MVEQGTTWLKLPAHSQLTIDWDDIAYKNWDSAKLGLHFMTTAVSTKVVPQKRYSVRNNAEESYGYKEFGVD